MFSSPPPTYTLQHLRRPTHQITASRAACFRGDRAAPADTVVHTCSCLVVIDTNQLAVRLPSIHTPTTHTHVCASRTTERRGEGARCSSAHPSVHGTGAKWPTRLRGEEGDSAPPMAAVCCFVWRAGGRAYLASRYPRQWSTLPGVCLVHSFVSYQPSATTGTADKPRHLNTETPSLSLNSVTDHRSPCSPCGSMVPRPPPPPPADGAPAPSNPVLVGLFTLFPFVFWRLHGSVLLVLIRQGA